MFTLRAAETGAGPANEDRARKVSGERASTKPGRSVSLPRPRVTSTGSSTLIGTEAGGAGNEPSVGGIPGRPGLPHGVPTPGSGEIPVPGGSGRIDGGAGSGAAVTMPGRAATAPESCRVPSSL